jgi:hypothetical protein
LFYFIKKLLLVDLPHCISWKITMVRIPNNDQSGTQEGITWWRFKWANTGVRTNQRWNLVPMLIFHNRRELFPHYEWKANTIPILMHQMCISTTQVSSVVLGPKRLDIRKIMWKLYKCQKETQILCHEIEPNLLRDRAMHEGNDPLIWEEYIDLLSSLQLFYSYSYFQVSTEVRTYLTVETLGDLRSTSRGLDPGAKM